MEGRLALSTRSTKPGTCALLLAALCASTLGLLSLPGIAGAGKSAPPLYTGGSPTKAPVLFILCNWGSGFSYHPNSLSYYQKLWTTPTAHGYTSLADYWRQVSFGQTTITGSNVLHGPHSIGGWYSMRAGSRPVSPVTYAGYGGGGSPQRIDRIFACMNAASSDLAKVHLANYQSVVTVTPYLQATAPNAISDGQTSIKLSSVSEWPSTSFDVNFTPPGGGRNYTDVQVSSIDVATKTLHLSAPWSLGPIAAGALITSVTSDDVGYVGPSTVWEHNGVFNNSGPGSTFFLGLADISAGDAAHGSKTNGVGDSAHEVGHSFGYAHSRAMASSITDYFDCWDQMSYNACGLQSPSTVAPPSDGAIGMDAIDLENQGWIPSAARYQYKSGQHTLQLHALSDPNALKAKHVPLLDVHIPAVVRIEDAAPSGFNPSVPPTCSGTGYHCDNSNYFTVEYRQPLAPNGAQTWDFGAGALAGRVSWSGAVVLHLHTPVKNPTGGDSFLVNTDLNAKTLAKLPYNGGLAPSFGSSADEFVDTATHTYVAVNAINPKTWTATVTISSNPIATSFKYTGPTTATYGQQVVLSGKVSVDGSGASVPNVPVEFGVADGLGCSAETNLDGVAKCTVSMTQPPETKNPSFNVDGQFLGDAAYGGIYMVPQSFTINKAPLTVTANNASRAEGIANPVLTATTTGFVLGQSLATSGVTGSSSCTTSATQGSMPGTYPITCTVGSLKASNYSFSRFVAGTLTVT
jgi:MBG domain (YGX type)